MLTSTEALAYVALRTGTAVPVRLGQWRYDRRFLGTFAAVLADLVSALFVLGYTHASLRLAIGSWWAVLFLYSTGWTVWQARSRIVDIAESDADTVGQSTFDALLASVAGVGGLAWFILGIAPPLIAGFFLFFDVMAPHEWPAFLPQ